MNREHENHCHGHGECCCGHEHEHHHDHGHHHAQEIPVDVPKKIYILENLGCANCAAKMEERIQKLPGVKMAAITFATKQLAVAADDTEHLLPEIRKICTSIESEVVVRERQDVKSEKIEKKSPFEENKKDMITIVFGAVLFVAGLLLNQPLIFIAAYILLGWEILWTAVKNIGKGRLFDENFLMSIATIGAFAIGDFAEAVGVMLFYRVGELFEEIAVSKSRSQIMGAIDMRPEVVNLCKGDTTVEIPAEEAKIGDIIFIRPGDRIPLDGIVTEGKTQLDTSAVTGEPVPVSVVPGMEIYSGCLNKQGALKLKVTKILGESMVSRILDSVENAAASKPKIDRFITKFAKIYTPIVVFAAIITAIIPSIITGNWNYWIYTAITFLVISCPCALVLSVPLAFFSGIGAGSKAGILFKGGLAMEALKDIKAVAMDKTGTITEGNFVVKEVRTFGRFTQKQILTMAADCELASTHPIGKSIVEDARNKNYWC